MVCNTLYQKRYDKTNDKKFDVSSAIVTPEKKEYIRSHTNEIKENTIYVKSSEKDRFIYPFVHGAINFSNDMCMDVVIVQDEDHINVCFTFKDIGIFTELKKVIDLADEIFILSNKNEIELNLSFHTHTTTGHL